MTWGCSSAEDSRVIPAPVLRELGPRARQIRETLSAAMIKGNQADVDRVVEEWKQHLGKWAGYQEAPDSKIRKQGSNGEIISGETREGFAPYLVRLEREKWWEIGEDPTKNDEKLRSVGSVLQGCAAALRAQSAERERITALACDAGDYLVWTQGQAGSGLFPFPARLDGPGKVFQSAGRALRRARIEGRFDEVVRRGWVFEDRGMDPGGLQFDNGICGVAMFELAEVTGDRRYLDSAVKSAEWALTRDCVPNWNYNAFSVEMLACAYRATGESRFFEASLGKAKLGVLPGQLVEGVLKGRWSDPHNAMPAYHFIMIRALGQLRSVMPDQHPDLSSIDSSLRMALDSRLAEYTDESSWPNLDSALDALLVLERHGLIREDTLEQRVLGLLIDHCLAVRNRGAFPVSPGIWGRLLEVRLSADE